MDLSRNNAIIPNQDAIFEAVKHCVNSIAAYIASDKPLSRRYATSMKHKLEVWAKYSGATSRQGLSLDDRVAALPSVKNAILGLLSLVLIQVKQASSLPDQEINIPDDSIQRTEHVSLEDSSNQEIRGQNICLKPWSSVAKAINSLFKLAAAVRDSDNSGDDIETPAHYSRPDDEYFESIAKLLVRRWFPHAKRELSDQLGHGIFVRRRKILYRQRHEEKLQFHRSSILADQTDAETIALPKELSMLLRESPNRRPEQLRAYQGKSHVVAPSLTQFSQFHTQSTIMRRTQAATVITSRTRGALIHETAGLNYPEVPKSVDPSTPVFCPYCCQRLTQSQLLNWRRHVDADLKPFICISETCQHPLKFFSLQSDWLQHMDEYHGTDWCQTVHMTTWFCNIEHGEMQEFVKIEDFHGHLDTHKLSNLEKDVLIRHNQAIGTRASGICPLCEDTLQHKGNLGARVVFDHIANHLRRIALIALPAEATDPELDKDAGVSLQSDKAILPDTLSGTDNLLSRSNDTRHMQEEGGAELTVDPPTPITSQHPRSVYLQLERRQIAQLYRGWCLSFLPRTPSNYAKWCCTLGCDWSHKNRSNWEWHEKTHYPQEIWICSHKDCLDRSHESRVSFGRDLARRHNSDYHGDRGDPPLSDYDIEVLREPVLDSLFPRQCVFLGCDSTFDSFDDRSLHIRQHLANGHTLCRDRIVINRIEAGSTAESTANSLLNGELEFKDRGVEDMGFRDSDDSAEQDYTYRRGTDHESAITNHLSAAYPRLSDDHITGPGNLPYEELLSRCMARVPSDSDLTSLLAGLRLHQVSAQERELEYESAIRNLAAIRGSLYI